MYSLIFRSKWIALMWALGMVGYAVMMTSGGPLALMGGAGLFTSNQPRELTKEERQRAREEREAQKFKAWAASDRNSSESTTYGSGSEPVETYTP